MRPAIVPGLLLAITAPGCFQVRDPVGVDVETETDTEAFSSTNTATDQGSDDEDSSPTSATTPSTSSPSSESSTSTSTDDSSGEDSSDETGIPTTCGNSEVEDGEACDDGNDVDGDGCNVDCVVSGTRLLDLVHGDDPEDGDGPRAVHVTSNGDFVVIGAVMRTDLGQGANAWIRRYRDDGTVRWTDTYNAPGDGLDVYSGIDIDDDRIVVIGTESRDDLAQGDNIIVREYDGAGDVQWTTTYNTAAANLDDTGWGVAITDDGRIRVGGYVNRFDIGQSTNVWFAGYDADGDYQWSTTWDGPPHTSDICSGFRVDAAGNGYCAGYYDRSDLEQGHNQLVIKTTPTGDVDWIWSRNSDGNSGDTLWAMDLGDDGSIGVVGSEWRDDLGQSANIFVGKLDADGNELWTRTFDGEASLIDLGTAIAVDADGNVIAGGWMYDETDHSRSWVAKLDADGDVLWTDIDDVGPGNDSAWGIDAYPDGRIVVAGAVDPVGDDSETNVWLRIYAP